MPFFADAVRLAPLFAAAAVSLALGAIAWRRRAPGARAFAVLMFATAEWAATYALEMVATDLPGKLDWERLTYIGSAAIAPAWLLFTLSFTDWRPQTTRRSVFLLLAIQPLLDWALVWTNASHGLMWSEAGLDAADLSLPLAFTYGPVYFVMLAYNYALMLFGVWLIVRTLMQSGRLYSRQSLALLVGVAAPLAGNVIYNANLVGTTDPTAFAFTITGLAFFWGFQRYGLLDLTPVARNSIFQVLRDAVLVLDPFDRVVDVNPTAELVLGQVAGEAIGKPLDEVLPKLSVLIHGLVDAPADGLEIEFVGVAQTRHYEVRVSPLHGRGGRPAGRVIVMSDITRLKRAEEITSHRALHDILTDLPNRALFQTRLGQAIQAAAHDRSEMALLVIDLDGFKNVNDTLGHACGDRLLQDLGQRWQAQLRDGDTLARLGGDEFGIALPAKSGYAAANLLADRLQGALELPFTLEGHGMSVGASIGIAVYPDHGADMDALLRHADMAMYAAKRSAISKAA